MLEATFVLNAVSAESVAQRCLDSVAPERAREAILVGGKRVRTGQLEREVRGRKHFVLEIDRQVIDWSEIDSSNHALLVLKDLSIAAEEGAIAAVSASAALISARWYNPVYDEWQNAEDPLLYETAGRTMEGLAMRDNGLPPPLNKVVVDVSRNPGRRVLREGYVEAIAHRMWLGPAFFERVPGVSRDNVTSASWLTTTSRPDGILDVIAHEQPFDDITSSEIQVRLRKLLFPTTADLRSSPLGWPAR